MLNFADPEFASPYICVAFDEVLRRGLETKAPFQVYFITDLMAKERRTSYIQSMKNLPFAITE